MSDEFKVMRDFLKKILIKDVMTKPVTTVHVNEDFSVVEEIFVTHDIRHLPVVDDAKKIVGIISQKDVYRRIAPRRSPDGKIVLTEDIIIDKDGYYEKESLNKYILNYVMSKNPVVLTEEKSLGDAIHAMAFSRVSCVPIVDGKKHVIGILTRIDILKFADKVYTG